MADGTAPAVTLRLLVAVADTPPMQIGTVEVQLGSSREQLAGLIRTAADEVEWVRRSARATHSGSARRTRGR